MAAELLGYHVVNGAGVKSRTHGREQTLRQGAAARSQESGVRVQDLGFRI